MMPGCEQRRGMFGRGDRAASAARLPGEVRESGIVRLGRAGGENDRALVIDAKQCSELLTRVFQPPFGGARLGVEAARVVPETICCLEPRLARGVAQRRGGIMVEVRRAQSGSESLAVSAAAANLRV